MAEGTGLTVIIFVAAQPDAKKLINAVPADTPLTIPVGPTVATDVGILDHRPPVVRSLSGVVALTQTCGIPVIARGEGLTVIVVFIVQPVPSE